ncbi:MAG: hypothetical protein ISS16_10670 [Ignavibacteria bacterium]|nr:hypothetical protein [Ignavibacteria bacterium]
MEKKIPDRISNMKDAKNKPSFSIWLLGDSEPANWDEDLEYPLDPRHPAIHNIWTPIISNIQDKVYGSGKLRVNEDKIYIRNAIKFAQDKPARSSVNWSSKILDNLLDELSTLIKKNNPVLIFSFGSFSYEFARRTLGEDIKEYGDWNTLKLGDAFRKSMDKFDITKTNLIPLLHATIARGRFLKSHQNFCNAKDYNINYFEYTAESISDRLLENKDKLDIWIK